jgi:dTDP-4-dehydrorhamnose reductase
MKILLFGKNGQLGWELQRALSPLGELIALDRSYPIGDLAKLDNLSQTVRSLKPDIVVNAAGYTAVDKAETEPETAKLINAKAPEIMAKEVASLGAWLVHYSSDYVFDGSGNSPWQESDEARPCNCYGQTKLAGEQAIQASGCQYLIFRTSWVYGSYGNNFVKTILRLAQRQEKLHIVNDQIGAPTGADLLADVTAHVLRQNRWNSKFSGGLYHVAAAGETSWYEYANFIVDSAKELGELLQSPTIAPIASAEYCTAAKRPLNSRLATTKLMDTFSLNLPHWQAGVSRMLKEILGWSGTNSYTGQPR